MQLLILGVCLMDEYSWTALQFLMGLFGVFAHFLKSKIKGQTTAAIKNYFLTHNRDTLLALICYIAAFVVLYELKELSFLTAFMAGYTCDTFFSRMEKNGLKQDHKNDS